MKRALAIPLLVLMGLGCCDGPDLAGPRTVELRGRTDQTNGFFGFSAHQSAAGQISGHIISRSTADYSSPFVIEGRVTCLRVVGNRASIGGEVERNSSESISDALQYHGWVYFVEDNRGHAGVADKGSKYIYISIAPPRVCPTPSADSATVDVTDGDVIVSSEE